MLCKILFKCVLFVFNIGLQTLLQIFFKTAKL